MASLRRSFVRRYRLFAPRPFRRGLILLALLLFCDGIATLYLPQLQAALSLNVPANSQITTPLVASMNDMAELAADNFTRPNQSHWGSSPDGQNWLADSQTTLSFPIAEDKGIINATPRFLCAVLGPVVADSEVRFDASLSNYAQSSLGAVLRWNSPNDFYKVTLDQSTLTLTRMMDGMEVPLHSIPFHAHAGSSYTFLFRATGSQLSAMVWPTGQPPLTDWQISFSDSALSAGRGGIGGLVQTTVQAQISDFKEVAL